MSGVIKCDRFRRSLEHPHSREPRQTADDVENSYPATRNTLFFLREGIVFVVSFWIRLGRQDNVCGCLKKLFILNLFQCKDKRFPGCCEKLEAWFLYYTHVKHLSVFRRQSVPGWSKVMFGSSRSGGVRGGQDQFNWDEVKVDKHRENYLGKCRASSSSCS